ncbi:MAG TPA: GTPase Era [Candidatus Binataceae bacterium]|nr:GTPase Era [Candidatus Binataceae bacterium]
MAAETAGGYRAGFVVLGGRSNVGKSTLLNRLVGHKVAIVTPRPQTTRARILGVRTDPGAQFLILDTPGLHDSPKELNRRMVENARRALSEGEVVLAVVEAAARLDRRDAAALAELAQLGVPMVIVINKVDTQPRENLLPLIGQIHLEYPGAEIVPISALRGENIEELVRTVRAMLPESPPLMPEDEYTDQTERMLAAEVIREKIFLTMRQEVPFSSAVRIETFSDEAERNLKHIAAVIAVERESHKGMLIGAGGQTLKRIGTAARLELEPMLGARVFLELLVKVVPNWTRDPRRMTEFGL